MRARLTSQSQKVVQDALRPEHLLSKSSKPNTPLTLRTFGLTPAPSTKNVIARPRGNQITRPLPNANASAIFAKKEQSKHR